MAYGNAADLVTFNDLGDWTVNVAELDDDQRALLKSLKRAADLVELNDLGDWDFDLGSNLRPNIFDSRCELDASCQTTEPISVVPRAIAMES